MRIAPTLRGDRRKDATGYGQVSKAPLLPVPNLPPAYTGRPYMPTWSVHKAVAEAYERVVWLWRCVNAMADAWSWLRIFQQQGRWGPELDDAYDTAALLNDRPNTYEVAANFKRRLTMLLLLSKEGVFVENVPTRDGQGIASLHILPPGYTHPIPGGDFVSGYSVWVPGTNRYDLAPERVTWIKYEHPINPYMSSTPLEAAGLSIDTDYWARVFNRNFLRNDRRPSTIIGVHGEIGGDDADEIHSRLNHGPAGRISIIETVAENTDGSRVPGGGIDVEQLTQGASDAQYMALMDYTSKEIIAAFGYPLSVVTGDASGRTFANADAERLMFNQGPVRQHSALILSHFDQLDPDPTRFLGADHSVIPEIQAADNARRETGLAELGGAGRPAAITPNEYRRDYAKLPPVEGGDSLWNPVGLIGSPVGPDVAMVDEPDTTPDSQVTPDEPPNDPNAGNIDVTAGASTDANGHKGGHGNGHKGGHGNGHAVSTSTIVKELIQTELRELDFERLVQYGRKSEDGKIAFGRYRVDADRLTNVKRVAERTFHGWEVHVRGLLTDYFKRQEKVTLEKLHAQRTLSGTRHWSGGAIWRAGYQPGKGIDPTKVFDRGMWDAKLHELAGAWQESIFETYGAATLDKVRGTKAAMPESTPEFAMGNERTITWLAQAHKRVTRVNDTTWEAIRDQLVQGEAAGEGIDQLAERVQSVFAAASDYRAETIARTEVLSASNAGSLEGAQQSGVVTSKVWLAIEDERTRETHAEADGQSVALDDVFTVGDDQLDCPGDPDGSPEETINCRCQMTFGTGDDGSEGDLLL